jgi:hypothetical protein
MADTNCYLLRSDDGQLYRVTKDQLAQYKVGPADPANQKAAQLAQLHETAAKAVGPSVTKDLVCFFALRDSGGPPKR